MDVRGVLVGEGEDAGEMVSIKLFSSVKEGLRIAELT